MKLMTSLALVASVVSGAAFAADLPSRSVAPAPVVTAPMFTWSGFYVGVNVGYGFGGSSTQTGASYLPPPATQANHWSVWSGGVGSMKGVLGGAQFGYNAQVNPWFVFGLEADIQGSGLGSNGTAVGSMLVGNNGGQQLAFVNLQRRIDWFGTVRGRLGVTMPSAPNLLLYVTGGLAYGQVKSASAATIVNYAGLNTISGWGAQSGMKLGWTLGAGVEWAMMSMPALSLKAEYLYTDLGSSGAGFVGGATSGGYYNCCVVVGATRSKADFHTVRLGLNYRFGAPGAGAVVARY